MSLAVRQVKLIRKGKRVKSGYFGAPSSEEETVMIDASIQPAGNRDLLFYPHGTFQSQDRVIYVMGNTTIEVGDTIDDQHGNTYNIISVMQDWRDWAGYMKLQARRRIE